MRTFVILLSVIASIGYLPAVAASGLNGTFHQYESTNNLNLNSGEWEQVQDGVYERSFESGAYIRVAFGKSGYLHDLDYISSEIARLQARQGDKSWTSEASKALSAMKQVRSHLRGLNIKSASNPVSGALCDDIHPYELDGYHQYGVSNATSISDSEVSVFGPAPPYKVTASTYSSARINNNGDYIFLDSDSDSDSFYAEGGTLLAHAEASTTSSDPNCELTAYSSASADCSASDDFASIYRVDGCM